MNKILLNIFKILIGFFLLGYLLYKLDIRNVFEVIIKTNFLVFGLMIVHYLMNVIVNASALFVLVKSTGEKTGFKKIFGNYWVSSAIGRFTPARLGEFSMIHFLNKEGISLGKSTLISVIFRIISLVTLIVISIFGLFLFFPQEQAIKIAITLVIAVFFLCFLIMSSKVRNFVKKFILKEKAKKFSGFSEALNKLLKENKAGLLLATIILITRVYFGALITCWIFLTYNIQTSVLTVSVINAIGLIISLIPVSISGLGVKESATVYLFSIIGINAVITGSIYLLFAFIYFAIAAVAIWIYMHKKQTV